MTYAYCCVYSEKLLTMDRGTVRNMYRVSFQNKFEKLVHLVGFIIRNKMCDSRTVTVETLLTAVLLCGTLLVKGTPLRVEIPHTTRAGLHLGEKIQI